MTYPFIQDPLLGMGLVIFFGYFFGHWAVEWGLPKITGYLAAGLLLNPTVFGVVPQSVVAHTGTMVNVLLCIITFEIGGALEISKIRSLGKSIVVMTVLEAEGAFFAVILGMIPLAYFLGGPFGVTGLASAVAFSLLMGGLVSPTDPAATIAVAHQYNARGPVTLSILGISAFDDAFGIVNFALAVSLAKVIMSPGNSSLLGIVLSPLGIIFFSLVVGCVTGMVLNHIVSAALSHENQGALALVLVGGLMVCYGLGEALGADELLATMTMGAWVVNRHPRAEEIFGFVETTLEEPVFLIFFCVSGMALNMPSLMGALVFIPFVVVLRLLGKGGGVFLGGHLAEVPQSHRAYIAGGLVPLGGIVIGLALTLQRDPALAPFASTLINVIIGCTVIHEFAGPLTAKWALSRAREMHKDASVSS